MEEGGRWRIGRGGAFDGVLRLSRLQPPPPHTPHFKTSMEVPGSETATCQVTVKASSPLTSAVIFFSSPSFPLWGGNSDIIIAAAAAAAVHVGLRRQIGGLFSPHVASLQRDLASVHMLTAGSLVEGMICQPLFMKGRQREPVR